MIQLIDHAAAYTQRGWVVIPMIPGTKKAYVKWRDITEPDLDRTRGWWMWKPDASIGVLCGPSNLIVVDIDSDEHLDRVPPLPATATVTTGRGTHRIYSALPVSRVPTRGGWIDTPGIDIRAAGGLFVAPPSLHKSGARYEWNPDDLTHGIQPAPRWMQPPARRPRPLSTVSVDGDADRRIDGILQVVTGAPEGQRNSCLNWAAFITAGYVNTGSISRTEAESRLINAATSAGLGEHEAAATVRSGLDSGGPSA